MLKQKQKSAKNDADYNSKNTNALHSEKNSILKKDIHPHHHDSWTEKVESKDSNSGTGADSGECSFSVKKQNDKNQKKKEEVHMPIFETIDSINIKFKQGKKCIRINGKTVLEYDNHGVHLLDYQIEALTVNSLGHFNPILIEFSDSAALDKYPCLKTIVAAFSLYDDDMVHGYITFVDPDDISKEQHESYQLALEKIVNADKRLELDHPVQADFSKKELKQLEKLKKESDESGGGFHYSSVGFVCFNVLIEAPTFGLVFETIGQIVTALDKKARKTQKNTKAITHSSTDATTIQDQN